MTTITENLKPSTENHGNPSAQMNWPSFPSLEEVFKSNPELVLATLEQTYTKLQRLAAAGPYDERTRARVCGAAYRHTLNLMHEIRQAKEWIAAQDSNLSQLIDDNSTGLK